MTDVLVHVAEMNSAPAWGCHGSNIDRVRTVVEPLPNELSIEIFGIGTQRRVCLFRYLMMNSLGGTGSNDRGQLGTRGIQKTGIYRTPARFEEIGHFEVLSAAGDHAYSRDRIKRWYIDRRD